jgi:ATP-binding cassette, subfamily B, bacterial
MLSAVISKTWNSDSSRFFRVLPRSSNTLNSAWWALIILRGAAPALFSLAVGYTIAAVNAKGSLSLPLTLLAVSFVAMLVLTPLLKQVGEDLGDRLAIWLYDVMLRSTTEPPGIEHLESPDVAEDLALGRDFDLGMAGPPLALSMSIISNGLVLMVTGVTQTLLLFGFAWWAPFVVGGAWLSTHWFLRESTVWDRSEGEVRAAQRQADYAYRLAADAPAAKETRVFGLADWIVSRFAANRRHLVDTRLYHTRLRQRPLRLAIIVLVLANGLTGWAIADGAATGHISTAQVVVFAQAMIGASMIAFGGLNWALPIAADSVGVIMRLRDRMMTANSITAGEANAAGLPTRDIVFRDVTFSYPGQARTVLSHLDLRIPAGSSLAIVGLNGEGKTTLIKLLCRLYDPGSGTIEADGQDIRNFTIESWRSRITAVFQDFAKYELPLRDNVAPHGATDEEISWALNAAGAGQLRELDAVLGLGYEDGTDLSGGQWQRVALARALCAIKTGAGVVILDEPTAQLDVRAEADFFDRFLDAAGGATTLLISHRFSTVRHADQICVLDRGSIVELGSHDELMTLQGRYHELFELQASRYAHKESNV